MRKLFLLFHFLISVTLSSQNYYVDLNFNTGLGADDVISNSYLQSDGKIIIVGNFTSYDGITKYGIARLNSNGSLDQSFDAGKVIDFKYAYILSIVQQQDGKVLIAGSFTKFNDTKKVYIIRLNTDGSLDNTFNSGGTGASDQIYSIALQPDGKILIAGFFSYYNGVSRGKVARLNTDGSLDTTFDSTVGSNNFLMYVSIQSDGKVLIGGYIDHYNNSPRRTIARLNTNGSLDNSFAPYGSESNNPVDRIVSQDDGKIIVSGSFSGFNNVNANGLTRLNQDGSTDLSFVLAQGLFHTQFSHLMAGGKILVNTYNGSVAQMYCLKQDGSVDQLIGPSGKANVQPNGAILISGGFTSYNGVNKKYIVRLLDTKLSVSDNTKETFQIYPNPVKNVLNIKTELPIFQYEIYSLDGKKLQTGKNVDNPKIDVSQLQKGNYLLKAKTKNNEQITKFIKE